MCALCLAFPAVRRLSGGVSGPLPLAYSAWTRLKAFEVTGTNLTGTIPAEYFGAWSLLENFTVDGASISGSLPPPWQCYNLKYYIVKDTPVVSNVTHPVWMLDPHAVNLTQMAGIGLGKLRCVHGSTADRK